MLSLPRKLKNMNLFEDGLSYLGQVATVTLPTLTRKTEEYRAGGMNAPVDVDLGMEKLELEWGGGGWIREVLAGFGDNRVNGRALRFAGALQRDESGQVDSVQVVVRGRHTEIGFGESKPGEDTEMTVKTSLTLFALYWNGQEVIFIDVLNMIERVNGVDRIAAQRAAIL